MFQSPLSSAMSTRLSTSETQKTRNFIIPRIRSELEKAFNFENHPYLFIDSKMDEKLKSVPSLIKTMQKKPQNFITMSNKCVASLGDLVEVDTRDEFNKILYSYLVKRRKMKCFG